MPDPQMAINITGNDADAARMIARQQRDIDKLKGAYRELAQQGKETGSHVAQGFVESITALEAAKHGIDMVAEAIETMGRRSEETADKTQGLIRDITAFAALQSGKPIAAPVQQVLELGTFMGVAKGDLGKLMNLAGSIQRGVGGDAKAGLRETAEALMVHQLGMPLETMQEITDRAKAVPGADIGQMIREVKVLGGQMKVDPAVIAKAMASLEMFKTPEEGFAMAATLGARLPGRKAIGAMEVIEETFGVRPPKELLGKLKRAGARPEAGIMANLEAVAGAGIVEPEDFQKRLGVTDVSKAIALSIAAKNVGAMKQLAMELPEKASEAAFAAKVAGLEAQMPEFKAAREMRTAETQAFLEQTTGAGGIQAMMDETERFERGTAARRRGRAGGPIRQGFEERGIDEQGRETLPRGFFRSLKDWLFELPEGKVDPLGLAPTAGGPQTSAPLTRKFDATIDRFNDGISKMRGGAALSPAGEDR